MSRAETHAPSTATGPTRRHWRLILILSAFVGLAPLALDLYLPALPSLSRDLEASTASTQASLTACLLGLALGQLVAGPSSDARGRRLPMLVGLVGFTILSLLCALAPSIWVLIALRFLQGVAGATGQDGRDDDDGDERGEHADRLQLDDAPQDRARSARGARWRGAYRCRRHGAGCRGIR